MPHLSVVRGGRPAAPSTPAPPESPGSDVRWDRVRSARARISTGYYDRPDVKERVLAAVLEEIDE